MPRRVTAATSVAIDIVTYIVTKKSYFKENNTIINSKWCVFLFGLEKNNVLFRSQPSGLYFASDLPQVLLHLL